MVIFSRIFFGFRIEENAFGHYYLVTLVVLGHLRHEDTPLTSCPLTACATLNVRPNLNRINLWFLRSYAS